MVPGLNKPYLAAPKQLGPASTLIANFRKQIKNINGVGKIARECVELFERLTYHQNLTRLTFLSWSEVLTSLKLHRNMQAWCSACYEEMRCTGRTVYQPLIWTVELLQICPSHRVQLIDRCPQCNCQFLGLTRRLRLGFCPKCECWLGREVDASSQECLLVNPQLEWQEFVCENICELISFKHDESHPPAKNCIASWLQIAADRVTGGKMARLSALLGKPNLTVHEWRHGRVKPILFELLRICYCLNIRLVDLLTEINPSENRLFNFRQLPYELEPIKKPRTIRSFDPSSVKRQLEKYLTITPPISMTRTAAEMGYDRGRLYKYFPELYRKISSRYKEFLQAKYKKQRIQREEEVRAACIELYRRDVYLTARTVADLLGKPSYKGRRDVRAIILATRKQLGQSRK
jgi:hypothetical protein